MHNYNCFVLLLYAKSYICKINFNDYCIVAIFEKAKGSISSVLFMSRQHKVVNYPIRKISIYVKASHFRNRTQGSNT